MYQKFGIFEPYQKYTKSEKVDEGRYAVTKNDSDKYVFKVPVLRNVAMTPPYFHDGSVDKLADAVWIDGVLFDIFCKHNFQKERVLIPGFQYNVSIGNRRSPVNKYLQKSK